LRGFVISGKAGAGKTSLASEIVRSLQRSGKHARRLGFADYLKEELYAKTGLFKSAPGGREALIRLADEMRAKDPDVFLKELISRYRHLQYLGIIPVVDDCRFPNEFDWAKQDPEIVTVRVWAPSRERAKRLQEEGLDPSIAYSDSLTETSLDLRIREFDRVVHNRSPLEGDCLSCEARRLVLGYVIGVPRISPHTYGATVYATRTSV
jgi:hypothetical protein